MVDLAFEDLIEPVSISPAEPTSNPFDGLPHFLSQNAKITLDHNGAYHKGFLEHSPEGGFQFVVKRNLRSSKIDFVVPLRDLRQSWSSLVGDNTLLPGHTTVSSFLHPNSSNNAPSANFVSAKNLLNTLAHRPLLKPPIRATPTVMLGSNHTMRKKGG